MTLKRVQSGDRLILRRADDDQPDVEAVVERSHGWGEVVDVQTDDGEGVIVVQPDGSWWWVRQPDGELP